MTEITLIFAAIESTFVGGKSNEASGWFGCTSDTTVHRDLWDDVEFVDGCCDLMTIDLMTTGFDMHSNCRRALERILTKWAVQGSIAMGRRSVVLGKSISRVNKGILSCGKTHLSQSLCARKVTGADKAPVMRLIECQVLVQSGSIDEESATASAECLIDTSV